MKTDRFKKMNWILAGGLALALLGCATKPDPIPQPPTKFDVSVSASPTINRDPEGNPLSVVVRFYSLKDKTEFSKLTFDVVSSGRTEAEMLGSDFLAKSEIIVIPGGSQTALQDLAPGTKYIGVVAFFRQPDPHYWRYMVTLDSMLPVETKDSKKKNKDKPRPNPSLNFKVEDCYLAITGIKPELIPGQPENAKPDCGGVPRASATVAPLPSTAPEPTRQGATSPAPGSRAPKQSS